MDVLRRLWFRLAVTAALLLLVGTSAISYRWSFGYAHPSKRFECFIVQGDLYVNIFPADFWSKARGNLAWQSGFGASRAYLFAPLVSLPRVVSSEPGRWHVLLPPYVPFVALVAVLLYPRLPFVRRRWYQRRGLCTNCGYNLTGNVSGRCPECGTVAQNAEMPSPDRD